MFPVQQKLLPVNKYTRPGKKLTAVKGIVIHWTANESKGADADAHYRYFSNAKSYASAHYFVDSQKIYQLIPDGEMAYHVGAQSYKTSRFGSYPNGTTIGIEMCVNTDGNFQEVYNQTVELAALLLKKYKLDPELDLVRHYDVTGKNCPAMFTSQHWGRTNHDYAIKYGVGSNADKAWTEFKSKVKTALSTKATVVPSQSKPSIYPYDKSKGKGVCAILADSLNVRKGPGTTYGIAKQVNKPDVYYVYDSQDGFYCIGTDMWVSGKYVEYMPHPK